MYKIFVGDKPIIITTDSENVPGFKNYSVGSVSLDKVIRKIKKKKYFGIRIIGSDVKETLNKFIKKIPKVVAAGGKVRNNNNQILFIYRNGKWDLPKGKAEPKETIDKTALREVEEETGIQNLSISNPLEITYHIFKRNGDYQLKITYWFEMFSDFSGPFTPQIEEGITKVEWISQDQIPQIMQNTYANIKNLV